MASETSPLLDDQRRLCVAKRSTNVVDSSLACSTAYLKISTFREIVFSLFGIGVTIAVLLVLCSWGRKVLNSYSSPPQHKPQISKLTVSRREVTFLSLNAFMRPVVVGARDYERQRLPRLLDAVSSYTIACNQEIFWLSLCKKPFFEQLSAHVPYHVSAPSIGLRDVLQWPPKLVDGGLSIVSRYPITDSDFQVYSAFVGRSIDAIVAKGVLYALINIVETDGEASFNTHVHVFTTHLQASGGRRGSPWQTVRELQLHQLEKFIQSKVSGERRGKFPIILAGDFNIDGRTSKNDPSTSPEYKDMVEILSRALNFKDIILEASSSGQPITSAGGLSGKTQKNERLDYIFFAEPESPAVPYLNVSDRRKPGVNKFCFDNEDPAPPFRTLSDHYGVEATFSVSGST